MAWTRYAKRENNIVKLVMEWKQLGKRPGEYLRISQREPKKYGNKQVNRIGA